MVAYHAERIFDGQDWHDDAVLVVEDGAVTAIRSAAGVRGAEPVAGIIAPGLVDLQVNGGGGVLFNNVPSPDGIATICAAHAGFGTTALMVTLITDRPDVTASAVAAAVAAAGQPGLLGLHLEGPHLDPRYPGTHDPALIRAMGDDDLAALVTAAGQVENLICTLAPESTTPDQIATLAAAGVMVSLGHSGCTLAQAQAATEAGARMVTHLFNAMGPLHHREVHLAGAALTDGHLWAGLIADGFHVAAPMLQLALAAKKGPAGLFLVSDAMSTIGSDDKGLMLNGRQITRAGGRLTLADGTLAGADIALIDAVRYLHQVLDVELGAALYLASGAPAAALGLARHGHLQPGARADFIAIAPDITVGDTWIGGQRVAG
jgi:N-acetylglucosamine-6-phosphate deacetylase